MISRVQKRATRRRRIRAKIAGTLERPRLAIFRSSKHLYAQLIDDDKGVTLVSASDLKAKKTDATALGETLAKAALAKGIKQAVFDRGGYIYTGTIKKLADGARTGGLKF